MTKKIPTKAEMLEALDKLKNHKENPMTNKRQRIDHLDEQQRTAIAEIALRLEELLEAYRSLTHPDMGQIVELDDCLINFRYEFPPTNQQGRKGA